MERDAKVEIVSTIIFILSAIGGLAISFCFYNYSKQSEKKPEYVSGIVLNSFCGTYKNIEIDCAQRYDGNESKYKLSSEQIKKACMDYIDRNKEMQKVGYSCCQMTGGPMVIQGIFPAFNKER